MKQNEEHPVLVAVATTIADGHPVDWESLAAEHPEFRGELEEMRALQKIELARRMTPDDAARDEGV